ncbi:HEAT repeat domain-containing protein [Myxococcota bacterium]|nr:HEAT repeat domain-containing protein [Myxococcota bacterium]
MSSGARLRSCALALLCATACATHPTAMLELMDAEGDRAIDAAAARAADVLADDAEDVEARKAAAKALGRLRAGSPRVIDALARGLGRRGTSSELRAMCAWALGELRSPGSLDALVAALGAPLDATTGEYVLEALAKHSALLSVSEEQLVRVVEAMVFFAANQRDRPPAIYDVLAAKTRTLPVSVRVLDRATVEARASLGDGARLAAAYAAAYEVLERIAASRAEILASGTGWRVQLEAAIAATERTFELEDPRTKALALVYLGRLAELPEVAGTASTLLSARASDERPALRLIAAWALARLMLRDPTARLVLARDVLPREVEGAVLALLAELSPRGDGDTLQKILGVEPSGGAR